MRELHQRGQHAVHHVRSVGVRVDRAHLVRVGVRAEVRVRVRVRVRAAALSHPRTESPL